MTVKYALITLGLTAALSAVGCTQRDYTASNTPGQRLEARAEALKQRAQLVQKGERLIAEGQAEVARGQAMVDQGDTLAGRKLIIEGEADIREGNLYLSQANAMELPAAPTTIPSNVRPYVRGETSDGQTPTVGTDVRDVDTNTPDRNK